MNNFAITISAIDKATATVRKVNDSFSKLTRPINQVGQSAKALGKELGIDKMAKSIGKVTDAAKGAASEIAKIGAPLAALVGGGSLIGIAMLANEWARLGSEIARTSRTIGVSAADLQSLRGAAQIAGVSSSELTSGMKSLGDTMQDALYGRNQDALAVLNKLGVGIHKTSIGAIDSTRAFNDLALAISNVKSPQVQGLIARQFGIESLLPLLRQGPGAIAAYQKKVRELGAEMSPESIRRAESFGIALKYLDVAGQGLRNTIGEALIPAFQPLIEGLTVWISKNRELIGQQLGKWAKDVAEWVRSIKWDEVWAGIQKTIKGIADFIDSIGGWKVTALGVAAVMMGPVLLSVTSLTLGVGALLLKLPLLITGLAGTEAAAGAASTAGMGLLGTLGKLTIAAGVAYAALKVAEKAGLPNTNVDQGQQDLNRGDWWAASAHLPAADFIGAAIKKLTGQNVVHASASVGSYAPILDMIGKSEGTDKGRGYNETLGYGAYTGGDQNLTGMTLDQIDALQSKMLANPANKLKSSALGRYQHTQTTLRDQRRKLGLKGDDLFTPELQDRLAVDLIKSRATGSTDSIQNGLAGIWASVPRADTGRSAYRQAIGVGGSEVRSVIAQSLKLSEGNGQQAAPIVSSASPRGTGSDQAAGQAAGPQEVRHDIAIRLEGMPSGTRATAQKSDGTNVPVRVASTLQTSMTP